MNPTPAAEPRVALVTGGAVGIGAAICDRLAAEGMHVLVADLDAAKAQAKAAVLSATGAQAQALEVNVADAESIRAAFERITRDVGRCDVVVNNAGIAKTFPFLEFPLDNWLATLAVNLTGAMLCSQHAARLMVPRRWGRIVNIASVAGKEGNPNASHYSASKAGLIALTKSLAKETATKGVLVNAIAPAAARTAIFDQMQPAHIQYMLGKIPMGRFVEVDEIAAMVACTARGTPASGLPFRPSAST